MGNEKEEERYGSTPDLYRRFIFARRMQQSGLWDAVSVSVSVSSGCDFLQNAAKCGECIVTDKNLALHKNQ